MASALRDIESLAGYTRENPLPEISQQEALDEAKRRGFTEDQIRSTYVGQDMKPFESTVNPFNPNFRASVGSKMREFIDDFGFSGGYKQGLENLSDATEFSLDFIPGVGDAVGVGDLRQSISSGDRLGMGIDGAAVALGTIPIAGDLLAKGLKKGESALRNFGGPIPEVTRDTELLQRIGDPKSVNEMTVEMTDPVISQAPLITAEDLIDRPFITGMSDTSRSGLETVTSVNNVPLNAVMRGGKYFGLQPENLKRNIAFASAPRAVTGQLNRAESAQALGDRPVAFIPFGMRPESPDFATMSTDIMVPYAQKVMSKADKKILDKRIRTGSGTKTNELAPIKDWIGIDKATPEYLANLGGARKSVTKALDEFSSESRAITKDSGSLNKSQVRAIVTDPKQFSPRFGDIDMIYELDPTAVANKSFLQSDHPSYTAALQGRPLGALKDNGKANIFNFNPLGGTADTGFYDFRQKQLDAGRDFEIGGLLDSPTMKAFLPGGHGIITREMVDELIRKGLIKP